MELQNQRRNQLVHAQPVLWQWKVEDGTIRMFWSFPIINICLYREERSSHVYVVKLKEDIQLDSRHCRSERTWNTVTFRRRGIVYTCLDEKSDVFGKRVPYKSGFIKACS